MPSTPYASVIQAPNSLEVTVVRQPVVTVIEREIVSEEMMDSESLDEVVFSNLAQTQVPENNNPLPVASQESRGAVTKAEPLVQMNPAPPYPRIARQRGWEGTVRLEVIVGKDGIPGAVGIRESSGHGILDDAALRTVKQWKFSPARSGNLRFQSRITIPIRFTLIQE